MDQHKRAWLNKYKIAIIGFLAALLVGSVTVYATVTGGTPDGCFHVEPDPETGLYYCWTPTLTITSEPTHTATVTSTPDATGTITTTATVTATGTATVTVTTTPEGDSDNPSPFEQDYGIPTSIPGVGMPDLSNYIEGPGTPVALNSISTTMTISHSEMVTTSFSLTSTDGVTGTAVYTTVSGVIDYGTGIISSVVSYTGQITGYTTIQDYTDTITITTAPDWYAPQLPRDMADIGYTIEQLNGDTEYHISLQNWGYLFGVMTSMPFRLGKVIWDFFRLLGPFGLFMIWLIVFMLPAVLGFRVLLFIKNLVIRIFNFILWVIDWILKLWGAVPFKSS